MSKRLDIRYPSARETAYILNLNHVRFSSSWTHQHNNTVMEASMTRVRLRTPPCHTRVGDGVGRRFDRLLVECDELEGDDVSSTVLAVELIEHALFVDTSNLLEEEPVAQRVQVLTLSEMLECVTVIVAPQEPTDPAALDIFNRIEIRAHGKTSFSRISRPPFGACILNIQDGILGF